MRADSQVNFIYSLETFARYLLSLIKNDDLKKQLRYHLVDKIKEINSQFGLSLPEGPK